MSKSVRRPSPALIVAVVALVAALAGSAVALPGKNSVKKNDIAKNAVVSKAIKNDKVKGADVKESSLGKVPSAAVADSAGVAGAVAKRTPFAVWVGEGTHDIAKAGPFTVQGECVIDDGGNDEAILQMTTSAEDGAFDDNDGPEHIPFDPSNSPATLLTLSGSTGDADLESEDSSYALRSLAVAADGTTVTVTEPGLALNLSGHVGQCLFAGVLEQLN